MYFIIIHRSAPALKMWTRFHVKLNHTNWANGNTTECKISKMNHVSSCDYCNLTVCLKDISPLRWLHCISQLTGAGVLFDIQWQRSWSQSSSVGKVPESPRTVQGIYSIHGCDPHVHVGDSDPWNISYDSTSAPWFSTAVKKQLMSQLMFMISSFKKGLASVVLFLWATH